MQQLHHFRNGLSLLLCLSGWLIGQSVLAQSVNLGTVGKAKPLVVSGGLGANAIFSAGLPNADAPFNYFLSGNLNLNFFGTINVPLTFNYSDRRLDLSQGYSFNQFSLHPTYKWVTAHIGTNYMTFSPYTLNGHQFVGVGVEATPGKWNVQAMAGRLLRDQYTDTTITGPTFRRMGYGLKVAYNPGKYLVGLTLFGAQDDPSTIPETLRRFDDQVVTPKENRVVGLNFGTTLFHALQLNAEYANSVITKDQSPNYERVPVRSMAGLFVRGNATSESYNALKVAVNYNIARTKTIVGAGYERIDPNYTTLGGYYFVNDLANYTVNASQTLRGGKLQLSTNVGLQEDDIRKQKVMRQHRLVGSLVASAQLQEGFSMGINYSNFRSYRFLNDTYSRLVRVPGQIIDTLAYSLVSQTMGYTMNKVLVKTETRSSQLNVVVTYVGSQSARANIKDTDSKTRILNTSLTYSLGFLPQKAALNASISYFRNALPTGIIQGIGPTIGIQKTFLESLNTTLTVSALNVNTNLTGLEGGTTSLALNAQLLANMRVGRHHAFNFLTAVVSTQPATYVNGNVGYNFSF